MAARWPLVAVYADESCLGNGQRDAAPGGAGGLVEFRTPSGAMVRRDFWLSEGDTTNNRMALRSVIEAFAALSVKGESLSVVFTSDSKYLIDGLTTWVFGWTKRGWKKADGKPVENLALWHEVLRTVRASGHEVSWRWVRGHDGHPQNEYANHLATRAAARRDASDGLVASDYETWLTAARAKGTARGGEEPFPDPGRFTASPALPAPPTG
ncbi:MAG: ribonuclease HI [Gemmatimonadaceae bacterium]|nr:ribonuclease HI [Gemmatimonadaceae bacterium]